MTPATGATRLSTAITDFAGQARIRFATGMTGIKQVEARFGSLVAVTGGPTVDLTDPRYDPATGSTWSGRPTWSGNHSVS